MFYNLQKGKKKQDGKSFISFEFIIHIFTLNCRMVVKYKEIQVNNKEIWLSPSFHWVTAPLRL